MQLRILLLLTLLLPFPSLASGIDGVHLSIIWTIPFAGLILSVAIIPLLAPKLWHEHFGKITAAWTLLLFIPLIFHYSFATGFGILIHALSSEYIPFILLLLALFVVSGGIHITGNFVASPKFNVSLIALGTVLASFMGTTGASILLIRPLLRANQNRKHRAHLVIFFIFLVANIGGGLTPLGDPPLFLGFLEGVDFFWTLKNMFFPVLIFSSILLTLFFVVDFLLFKKENISKIKHKNHFVIEGKRNFILLIAILINILISGFWHPEITFNFFGTILPLEGIIRDITFIIITAISLLITPHAVRHANEFNWHPITEVAKLFLGIFLTIIPVIAILQAGKEGVFSPIIHLVHDEQGMPINTLYFWVTTTLSAFLDNAPTYLVFFKMAVGNQPDGATYLMDVIPVTLLAISMGTVFTGPLTYIGNAPNFMIKSLAEQQGIKMPSFFGYMFIAFITLSPIYVLLNFIFLL